jgi:hypothetical protein
MLTPRSTLWRGDDRGPIRVVGEGRRLLGRLASVGDFDTSNNHKALSRWRFSVQNQPSQEHQRGNTTRDALFPLLFPPSNCSSLMVWNRFSIRRVLRGTAEGYRHRKPAAPTRTCGPPGTVSDYDARDTPNCSPKRTQKRVQRVPFTAAAGFAHLCRASKRQLAVTSCSMGSNW